MSDQTTINYQDEIIDELRKELESAKQRELELLAVIKKIQNAFNFAMEMASEGDKSDLEMGHSRVVEALNFEPSQALHEHEAKVLEEAADWFEDREIPAAPEALRRMAEERRKN